MNRFVAYRSACVLAATLLGCSAESPGTDASERGATSSGGAGGSRIGGSGTGGSTSIACERPGHRAPKDEVTFRSLTATVVDLDTEPIIGVHAQACGLDLCLQGETGADGTVVIQSDAEMQAAAFKYGLGKHYAKFAYPLPEGAEHALGEQITARLPDDGQPLSPGSTVTSGGVSLELAAEMNPLEPDPFDFDTDASKRFRVVEIPIAKSPDAVDPSLGLERLFGVGPVGVELCPRPRLVVDNTAAWSPGQRIEVWLHGVEIAEDYAPYGGWAKVADAHVTDDGSSVITDDGHGLPILGVFGLRKAP